MSHAMSHATLAQPLFPTPIPHVQIQRLLRVGAEALLATTQSLTLAALLWLILAGPGFLQDLASIVPLR